MGDITFNIDEHALAAFIAGTLPEEERARLTLRLAHDAEARELLRMACEGTATAHAARTTARIFPTVAGRSHQRPSRFDLAPRMPQVAAAFVTIAVGIGLGLWYTIATSHTTRPASENLRLVETLPGAVISLDRSPGRLGFTWGPVDGANRYRLFIWDVDQSNVVSTYETRFTALPAGSAEMTDLTHRLLPGRRYAARIDAIDGASRRIGSSVQIDFTPDR